MPVAAGGTLPVPQKIHASDGTPADSFGSDIAMYGDVAVVAARRADDDHGAAYVFRRDAAGAWVEEQKLVTSGAANEIGYFTSVDLSGDVVAVGRWPATFDPFSSAIGSAYVFRRNGLGFWQQETKLSISTGFGSSVAVVGDWLFVGDVTDDQKATDAGAVRVFRFDAAAKSWTLQQTVFASNTASQGHFGFRLSADGDAFVASANEWVGGVWTKTAHVFRRGVSDLWIHEATLAIAGLAPTVNFGSSLSIKGEHVVVGAPELSPSGNSAAYIFERSPLGAWSLAATLATPATDNSHAFGADVALSGNRVLVGAGMERAFFFDRDSGGSWVHTGTATAPDQSDNNFGEVVALDGGFAAIGAPADADFGLEAGAAYLYDFSPPTFVQHGIGCPGSGGVVPQLVMTGAPTSGGQVQLSVSNGVGSGSTVLAVGLGAGSVSMGYGCMLNIGPVPLIMLGPLLLFPLGAQGPGAGSISFGATLPPSLPPVAIGVQAFVVDAGIAHGFSNTNGVVFTIQ
ncbi:MAG: hypothetical protein IT459_23140 [Planctomycetes bacterium]|nr:hypothetical protein [Planctomycetota bacterium]